MKRAAATKRLMRSIALTLLILGFPTQFGILGPAVPLAAIPRCDVDRDGDTDLNDLKITLLSAARNVRPNGPDDPRDADGNGSITVNDGRICVLQCTLPSCAIPASSRSPIANAGRDQNVAVGAAATLNGSGSSDPDNGPGLLTYLWTFASVPPGSGLTNASIAHPESAAPAFTPDVAGLYLLNLTVNDGESSGSDSVTIRAALSNVPPHADAGRDQYGAVGSLAPLNGGGSNDPDNGPAPLAYLWSFISVPPGSSLNNAAITNPTGAVPAFTPDIAGAYVLNLAVSDGAVVVSDQILVIASPPNVPPNADAGPDQKIRTGKPVTLNGGGSHDPDNGPAPLTYSWRFVSVPPGSQLTHSSITNPAGVSPIFTPDLDGTYILKVVADDGALTGHDQVMVTAGNAAPEAVNDDVPPVDEDTLLTVASPGVLSNDTDADLDPLTAVLAAGPLHGALTLNSDGSFTYMPGPNFHGTDRFTYRASDGSLESGLATVTITVNPINDRPEANVGPDRTVGVGITVQLSGAGSSDPENDPLLYQWTIISRPPGSTASLSNPMAANPTFIPDRPGGYEIQLIVNDGKANSKPKRVIITGNASPAVDAGPDQIVVTGETVQLNGVGSSDPEGDPITYRWAILSRPPGSAATLSNPTLVNPVFAADLAGRYDVGLIVNDGFSDSPPRKVMIRALVGTRLNCGSLISGTIGAAGESDIFIFTGQQGSVVDLTLVLTGGFNPFFGTVPQATLFAPSGAEVAVFSANSQNAITLPENGTYLIRINSSDLVSTGSYNVGMECRLPFPSPVDGTLSCGGLLNGAIEAPGEVDLITFMGQQGAVIDLTLVLTGGFNPVFGIVPQASLFAPSGAEVTAFSANSQNAITLPESGTYVVRVNSSDLASTGGYNLGMECRRPFPSPVVELSCGGLLNGAIDAPGEVDLITFTGQQGAVVDLTLVLTGGFTPVFGIVPQATLFAPSGAEVTAFSANSQNAITLPENGTYVVRVNSSDLASTGGYNLGMECRRPSPLPVDGTLSCGEVFSGGIEAAGEVDLITFTGQQGAVVDLMLVLTGGFNPVFGIVPQATLFAPSGAEVIAFSANSQNAITLPESGTYLIRINSSDLASTGGYNLGMECRRPFPSPVVELSCGGLLNGAIEAAGEVDLITFTGQQGAVVDLTLVLTGGFTPVFGIVPQATLFAPSGAEVAAFNADSQNAITLPENGTYVVRINSSDLASTGSYNLGLQCR